MSGVLNHVSVTVADLARSLRFYNGLLGLPILGRGYSDSDEFRALTGYDDMQVHWAELDLGPGFLELFQYIAPRGDVLEPRSCDSGATHFAITVTDLDVVVARLQHAGVAFRSDKPVTLKTGAWAGVRAIYCIDPDRVMVELLQFPSQPMTELVDVLHHSGANR